MQCNVIPGGGITVLLNLERAEPTEARLLRCWIIHIFSFNKKSRRTIGINAVFGGEKNAFLLFSLLLCCIDQNRVKPYSRSCSSDATAPRKRSKEQRILEGEKNNGKTLATLFASPLQT